jgi:hypothetical protein
MGREEFEVSPDTLELATCWLAVEMRSDLEDD